MRGVDVWGHPYFKGGFQSPIHSLPNNYIPLGNLMRPLEAPARGETNTSYFIIIIIFNEQSRKESIFSVCDMSFPHLGSLNKGRATVSKTGGYIQQ